MSRTGSKQRDPKSYVGQYNSNVMLKTYAPMAVRHLTGQYTVNIKDNGVDGDLKMNSVTDKQKVEANFAWNRKDGGRPGAPMAVEKSLGVTVNDMSLKFKVPSVCSVSWKIFTVKIKIFI